MRTPLIAAAVLALAAAPATAQTGGPSQIPDMSQVRTELRNVVIAQETFYSSNGRYSPDLGVLRLATPDTVALKFVEASPNSYAITGSLKGRPGFSCVTFIARVSAMPKTEGGRVAKQEGAVVCDGDPM
jgi:hypothetical protein